jgi:hypothetical protein
MRVTAHIVGSLANRLEAPAESSRLGGAGCGDGAHGDAEGYAVAAAGGH